MGLRVLLKCITSVGFGPAVGRTRQKQNFDATLGVGLAVSALQYGGLRHGRDCIALVQQRFYRGFGVRVSVVTRWASSTVVSDRGIETLASRFTLIELGGATVCTASS